MKKALDPTIRKEKAEEMMREHGISERRPCCIVGLSRTVKRIHPKRITDSEFAIQLRQLADAHPRWGFKKLYAALRNAGYDWNHKHVHRIYRALKLHLRVKRGKRLPKRTPQSLEQTRKTNECWSLDFMSDALLNR